MNRISLVAAALLALAAATPSSAQDALPSDWSTATARFFEDGSYMYLTLERHKKLAWLEVRYRSGPDLVRDQYGPLKVSPKLLERFSHQLDSSRRLAWRTLRAGDSGRVVQEFQKRLQRLGYTLASDGKLNPRTVQALRSYQERKGLPVTGTYDLATRKSLHPRRLLLDKVETDDERALGIAKVIALSTLYGHEPSVETLEGDFDHTGGTTHLEAGTFSYEIDALTPDLYAAVRQLGGAKVWALVWDQGEAQIALVTAMKVRASQRARPKGVAAGELVSVVGVTSDLILPSVKVRDEAGNVGVLESAPWAFGPHGQRRGASDRVRIGVGPN